jgi:hypothetical protein
MVNELRHLLRENVAAAPPEDHDLAAVLRGGRRQVRRRRMAVIGGTAMTTVAAIGLTALVWPSAPDLDAAGVPAPTAPTLRLSDAGNAVEGRDYRVLASYTNDDLDRDNGQYFDGVTDDGLILFRDGPRMEQRRARFALMDPATGVEDWLPDPGLGQGQAWPVELGADRLVLVTGGMGTPLTAHLFDRASREWTETSWPALPPVEQPRAAAGPDDRLYVSVPATRGQPPEDGWPTVDGEADDADAEGDSYALWSVSLDDPTDVRDEDLRVGALVFTDEAMVWTDRTNGDSGQVHLRDLRSGREQSFDPHSGDRCNLLGFGATADRIVLGQYCGTYDGVRDDRVQVLDTDGDQVVTLQDSSIEGSLAGDGDVVTVTSYQRGRSGTYVYDLGSGRFLRVADSVSQWQLGAPAPGNQFLWSTPVNHGNGATQWLGELVTR